MKVVMQRDFQGQDSWDAYKEQVAIDEKRNLYYRRSEGGNCEYGDWKKWEGEKAALNFVFGEVPLTDNLIAEFKNCLINAPELKDEEFNMDGY